MRIDVNYETFYTLYTYIFRVKARRKPDDGEENRILKKKNKESTKVDTL